MEGGGLIREARKRAGLSQQHLAERLSTSQSVIARWELGRSSPSFERVVEAIGACGLELSVRIGNPDHDHALLVEENLRLSPKQRLDRLISSRAAMEDLVASIQLKGDRSGGASSSADVLEENMRPRQGHDLDPEGMLRILAKHGVDHIVVGGVGSVLHGSPMSTDDLDIVPALRKANLDALASALNEMHARVQLPEKTTFDFTGKDLQRWIVDFQLLNLVTDHGRLEILYRPGGTRGYQDLAGDAEDLDLEGFQVRVASLEDIIRSKQAVARARDLEHLPTLRLLLERRKTGIRSGQVVIVPWGGEEITGRFSRFEGPAWSESDSEGAGSRRGGRGPVGSG